jgi:hypothetical protein
VVMVAGKVLETDIGVSIRRPVENNMMSFRVVKPAIDATTGT